MRNNKETERQTRNRTIGISAVAGAAMLFGGCMNPKYQQAERQLKQPINCATAEGDIRLLQHEKAHVTDQIASGVTAIVPAAAVMSVPQAVKLRSSRSGPVTTTGASTRELLRSRKSVG
jgi:hypothetical protein